MTQSVLQEFFAMVMLIDMEKMNCELEELREPPQGERAG